MIRVRANVGVSPTGELVMPADVARQLVRDLAAQLPPVPLTPAMLDAGVEATWLMLGSPARFLRQEVDGIVTRVYRAMRPLEG